MNFLKQIILNTIIACCCAYLLLLGFVFLPLALFSPTAYQSFILFLAGIAQQVLDSWKELLKL